MSIAHSATVDVAAYLPSGAQGQATAQRDLSDMARGIVGSQILKIANEIRALIAQGREVCNLTIGDFSPTQFPVPSSLIEASVEALNAGITNYPPSDGVVDLRGAVTRLYERELGIKYPIESVLIASGGRPLIYAAYRALINPGDVVVYPVPSWMNDNYCALLGARSVEIPIRREENFLPRADDLRPYIHDARLICLNTPVNPTGTMIEADELGRIGEMIVEENRRREHEGKPALYLLYDQMYWMLQFGSSKHRTPVEVVPPMAAYTIFVDGISKSLAATGLRVGWGVAPPHLSGSMKDIMGFVGAWAPHPLQVATAKVLDDVEGLRAYHETMLGGVEARLNALYDGFAAMADAGLPVEAVPPQGAIYLSVRFGLQGKTLRGASLDDNEAIRRYLLEQAGCAVVPFQAFGYGENTGWMRLSVGAVSMEQIAAMLPRVQAALTD
jgi:aspartate aminotransferase